MKTKLILATTFLVVILSGMFYFFSASSFFQKHKINKKEKSDAMEALQFLSAARAFPKKDIPQDAYTKAHQYYQSKFSTTSNKQQSSSQWQNIGPNNVGGRTLGIAINPMDTNIVWLGAASGGLWKSGSGGMNGDWNYIPTGFPVLGVSTIAINPDDTNVMFIGTGETYNYGTSVNGLNDRLTRGSYGIGILKSIDGGKNWTKSLDWSGFQIRGVWEIIFNPKNANIIYAATTEGIYKSFDSGQNWLEIFNDPMVMDLEIDRIDTNILYAGVGNLSSPVHGLFKTTNSGANWNLLSGNGLPTTYTNDGRITISSYYSNPKILITIIGNSLNTFGIFRSEDEGATWTEISFGNDIMQWQGWYGKALLLKSDDDQSVVAGGVYFYQSLDGGNTLVDVSNQGDLVHADIHDVISNPLDPNKIYIITDGGLYRSDDFGNSFYDCEDGYVTSQFYIGSVSQQDSNFALGGLQDNGTVRYGGTTDWDWVMGGDGTFNAINPLDDNIAYACYQYLQISRSDDKGFSFFNFIFDGSATAPFVAPLIICPSNPDVLYGGNDAIVTSTDGGFSWNNIGPVPLDAGVSILSIAVSNTSTDTLYCTTSPVDPLQVVGVFRSFDGGNNWQNIKGTLPNRYPRDIAVNPKNSRELFVVFSGFGSGHIFKSNDAGNNWMDVSGPLPDVPFHCVTIDPKFPNNIYAGSDMGAYVSQTAGKNWALFVDGLNPATMVFDLVISPSDRNLLAFTHGNGVYKRPLADSILLDTIPLDTTKTNLSVLQPNFYLSEIYPNPANEFVNLNFYSAKNITGEIFISDINGKIVLRENILMNKGKNNSRIDLRNLANGIYFLNLKSDKYFTCKKLMVLK